MSRNQWILLGVIVAVAIVVIVMFLLPKPTPSPAAAVAPVPVSPTPTPFPVLLVLPTSYLAKFGGQLVKVSAAPVTVGADYWLFLTTPANTTVIAPVDPIVATQVYNITNVAPGTTYLVQVAPPTTATRASSSVFSYPAYGTQQVTLTAGELARTLRGMQTTMILIYNNLRQSNFAAVQQLVSAYSTNSQLFNILSFLAQPGNLAAPLAITYNAAITLGLIPTLVAASVTSPVSTVVDFGLAA